MDANKRRYQYQTRTGYTEGNTARKQELADTYSMQKYMRHRKTKKAASTAAATEAGSTASEACASTTKQYLVLARHQCSCTIAIVATLYFY